MGLTLTLQGTGATLSDASEFRLTGGALTIGRGSENTWPCRTRNAISPNAIV